MIKFITLILSFHIGSAFSNSCRKYQADLKRIKDRKSCIGKSVHLTFDDGPHIKFTKKIMDSLKSNKVSGTFFVSTYQFDKEHLKTLEKEYIRKYTSKPIPSESSLNKRFDNHIKIRKKNYYKK